MAKARYRKHRVRPVLKLEEIEVEGGMVCLTFEERGRDTTLYMSPRIAFILANRLLKKLSSAILLEAKREEGAHG